MKDFMKWVDAWNTYNSAYDKAAEAGGGYSWTFFFMFLMFAASSVALFYGDKTEETHRNDDCNGLRPRRSDGRHTNGGQP